MFIAVTPILIVDDMGYTGGAHLQHVIETSRTFRPYSYLKDLKVTYSYTYIYQQGPTLRGNLIDFSMCSEGYQ